MAKYRLLFRELFLVLRPNPLSPNRLDICRGFVFVFSVECITRYTFHTQYIQNRVSV